MAAHSKGLEQIIARALAEVPVIDVHTHLKPQQVMAQDLCDIVHYHHVGSELIASGLPASRIWLNGYPHDLKMPAIPRRELVRRALPYLPNIRNTTIGYLLRTILEDLFGVKGGVLNEKNWEEAWAAVESRVKHKDWQQEVLNKRCRIKRSITVEKALERKPDSQFDLAWESWVLPRLFSFSYPSPGITAAALERSLGCRLNNRSALEQGIQALAQKCARQKLRAVGFWLPASFRYQRPSRGEYEKALSGFKKQAPSGEAGFPCWNYILNKFLDCLADTPVKTVTIVFGADRMQPHFPIVTSSSQAVENLYQLFLSHNKLHFNVFCASDAHTQDFAVAAKHLPNVSVAGYWWHTLYPCYIKKAISLRLDIVPANKIIAFFSDAFCGEWCYAKLKLVKKIFQEVLVEKVEGGYFSEETAVSLVRQTFFDNPGKIYNISEKAPVA